jgi:hypothetical protein
LGRERRASERGATPTGEARLSADAGARGGGGGWGGRGGPAGRGGGGGGGGGGRGGGGAGGGGGPRAGPAWAERPRREGVRAVFLFPFIF